VQAAHKYAVGMRDFVRRPSLALSEFAEPRLAVAALGLDMFISHRRHAHGPDGTIKHERARRVRDVCVCVKNACVRQRTSLAELTGARMRNPGKSRHGAA
jgi:hypothetical protein